MLKEDRRVLSTMMEILIGPLVALTLTVAALLRYTPVFVCACVCVECQGSCSGQVLKHVLPSGNFIERLSAAVGQTPPKCQWPASMKSIVSHLG